MEVMSLCHGCEMTVSNRLTFLGRFGACADNVYQALSPRPPERGGGEPGNEANTHACTNMHTVKSYVSISTESCSS